MSTTTSSRPRLKPLNSILVKPAGADCNLACEYCFYRKKGALYPETPRHRMSPAVLEALVRQVMRGGSPAVSFGWQGGEPTLAGQDFFRQAVELQKKYGEDGQSVSNGLQTNGLLLDKAWAGFLKQYKFLVGLSIDGTAALHDPYRRTRGGEPTWERVAEVARMLLDRGVAVNALCVVNDQTAGQPDALYEALKSLGLPFMQFIPCVEPDPERPGRSAPFSVAPEAYGRFLCRLFDRWLADFKGGMPKTFVRWFDAVFSTFVQAEPPECTLMAECGGYVVAEHNGDVYACDFFVDPAWRLGNLMETDLIELLNGERQREFGRRKAELPAPCLACRWRAHCRGGCPKDRRVGELTEGVNVLCPAYKMFFEHAQGRLERMAARWLARERERQARSARQERNR